MPLPAGVTLKSYSSSSPKLGTAPAVNNGVLTWNMSTTIRPGGKMKVSLKLAAANCTTPAALLLNGHFAYNDLAGAKTAQACLKKPLYVWDKTCAPIPKPAHGGAGAGKNRTGASGRSSFTCNCTNCLLVGKKYSCEPSACQCTSN